MAEMYVMMYLHCDSNETPHWCLYIVDDDGNQLIFEALGSTGHYFRYHSCPVNMETSRSEKQEIRIGRIEADVWPEIPNLLATVPMSTQAGWNCQNWVMQAIGALKEVNYLEEDHRGLSYIQGKYQKKRSASSIIFR